jgi:hypothetical protein
MKRKGYSGSAIFEYEIERLLCKHTGEYFIESELPEISTEEFESRFEKVTIPLNVEGNSWHSAGVYSAAPEDCYPDEGDTEIESVIGPDGKDWYNLLSDTEISEIIDLIESDAKDDDRYCSSRDPEDKWESFDRFGY